MIKIERALISVSDKTGIVDIAKLLNSRGVEILSTGGTARLLSEQGVENIEISDFTGSPEMLDGRVKTLHPKIYGGLLAIRDNEVHLRQMSENDIVPIDLIICNLYPFEETLNKQAADAEIVENIDIGGPTMLRAAAKNYKHVCVLSGIQLYQDFQKEFTAQSGCISEEFALRCAREVFRHTAGYDSMISAYFGSKVDKQGDFPSDFCIGLEKVQDLRYGENPQQSAAWYRFRQKTDISTKQLHGKDLSFNNLLDIESTHTLVNHFKQPACVITKHTNPCGVAVSGKLVQSYDDALATDDLSAFGGIAGFNREVTEDIAEKIIGRFYEVVIAPAYSRQALKLFQTKQDLRIIQLPASGAPMYDFRTLSEGLLVQSPDDKDAVNFQTVTQKEPSEAEMEALKFGWVVSKFVKSNAIVFSTIGRTLGIGAGQMSRYDAARVALMKMNDNFKGDLLPVVMASDAFCPFPDAIEVAKQAGATAVIQPGGSRKDNEVIDVCNKLGISMVFTGMRHFRH